MNTQPDYCYYVCLSDNVSYTIVTCSILTRIESSNTAKVSPSTSMVSSTNSEQTNILLD